MKNFRINLSFLFVLCVSLLFACNNNKAQNITETSVENKIVKDSVELVCDVYGTDNGVLKVYLIGHASLLFEYNGSNIYVDPYSAVGNYSKLPKADLILLTHEHFDHLDKAAIAEINEKDKTSFIMNKTCYEELGYGEMINNGASTTFNGVNIEAVPAYNIVHKKDDGTYYHPKRVGNGYILTFGGLKVYVAADTENIPEMDKLKGKIDIAFLPKNLPYTMTDDMFIDAAKKVQPKYLYPYHFSEFDETKINEALKGTDIKLIVRPMSSK